MSHRTHSLIHEFPEYTDKIHTLKSTDNHFKNLLHEYDDVCAELHRGGEGSAGIDDDHAEELKKKRLELKDSLFMILKASGAAKKVAGGSCCGSC